MGGYIRDGLKSDASFDILENTISNKEVQEKQNSTPSV